MAVTMGQLTAQILTDANRDTNLANPFGEGSLYATAIQQAILAAIYFCESNYYWNFKKTNQVTILQGENSVPLPADFNNMIFAQAVVNNNNYGPRQGFLNITYDQLISYFQNPGEQGNPRKYAIQNNILYVYPLVAFNTVFNGTYYFKDVIYPTINGSTENNGSSIWFDPETVDLVRLKAMQRFYHDTLQSFEAAQTYLAAFKEQEQNFYRKNNYKQTYNILEV